MELVRAEVVFEQEFDKELVDEIIKLRKTRYKLAKEQYAQAEETIREMERRGLVTVDGPEKEGNIKYLLKKRLEFMEERLKASDMRIFEDEISLYVMLMDE